jgi:hypothetical protein
MKWKRNGIIFLTALWIACPAYGQVQPEKETSDTFTLIEKLVNRSKGDKNDSDDVRTFLAISTKFSNRHQLMTEDVLSLLYRNYRDYNVLIDFLEKIPVQKPATVIKLFRWVRNFQRLHPANKALLTAIFQSIFEFIYHASKYDPGSYDCDALLDKLTDVPWDREHFYDKIFEFLLSDLGIGTKKKDLIDFLIGGLKNRDLSIDGTDFTFMIQSTYRQKIEEILRIQEICPLTSLLEINGLLDRLKNKEDIVTPNRMGHRLIELCAALPYAEMSKDAPKSIRCRVVIYSRKEMNEDLERLIEKINSDAPASEIDALQVKIKNDYLIHQFKDHLVALVYAVNAKYPKLRVFLNPNMVRLHDFDDHAGETAWSYCGTPPSGSHFPGQYFCGGLSRLNILFAAKWSRHLFRRTYVYNVPHVQGFLVNLLEMYPLPIDNFDIEANARAVDSGMELLLNAREKGTLKKEAIAALAKVTSGFHYRKAVDYLNGKSGDHGLFFSELKKLGETLRPGPHNSYSGIYYFNFGNLTPRRYRLFPQEPANLFDSGGVGGELVDEFMVKLGWHLYKKKIPSSLLGQVIYSYLTETVPRLFNQSHDRDYYATYFTFNLFNNSHLKRILTDLQKEGCLKLK